MRAYYALAVIVGVAHESTPFVKRNVHKFFPTNLLSQKLPTDSPFQEDLPVAPFSILRKLVTSDCPQVELPMECISAVLLC